MWALFIINPMAPIQQSTLTKNARNLYESSNEQLSKLACFLVFLMTNRLNITVILFQHLVNAMSKLYQCIGNHLKTKYLCLKCSTELLLNYTHTINYRNLYCTVILVEYGNIIRYSLFPFPLFFAPSLPFEENAQSNYQYVLMLRSIFWICVKCAKAQSNRIFTDKTVLIKRDAMNTGNTKSI